MKIKLIPKAKQKDLNTFLIQCSHHFFEHKMYPLTFPFLRNKDTLICLGKFVILVLIFRFIYVLLVRKKTF